MDSESPQVDHVESNDKVIRGVGFGCLCQLGFFLLGFAIAPNLRNVRFTSLAWSSWGVTQWIALIPLILRQRAKQNPRTVQGLLLIGFIGLLLSSACATLALW